MAQRNRPPAKIVSIESRFIEKGIKITGQRKIIADVIASSDDHPDVEKLYLRASQIDKKISLPTVYRTVKLFEEIGIIKKHEFNDGRARYCQIDDEIFDPHYHLIDLVSGDVVEFEEETIKSILKEIAKNLGYELVEHRLELYCRKIVKSKKEN